jgi:regulator of protease activity HflC (stomatin/prohibitin superfamily)
MRRLSTAILAFGIALVFVLYMVTYTVAYNEIAIITTFDSATQPDPALLADGKDTGSVMQEPGLKFKWPWPIQRVETYPTQYQILQDTPEQLQLSDGNTIIVNLALTWRIEDPLAFSIAHENFEDAEDKLRAQMRDLRSVISNDYTFEQLVNEDEDQIELDQMEQRIAEQLANRLDAIQPSYGIEVSKVTVAKMLYTESTAASVNERMTATQQRKAQEIRSQGDSQAEAIVSEAESISKRLSDFAETVASEIETLGREEANDILQRYAEKGASEDLAIYLRQLEAIEKMLANRTTFVLNAKTFTPLDVLVYGHGEPGNLSRVFEKESSDSQSSAPLSPEAMNQALMQRIAALEARIGELLEQIETLEQNAAPALTNVSELTTNDSEARP